MTHSQKGWWIVAQGIGLAALWAYIGGHGQPLCYLFSGAALMACAFVAAVNLGWINP
jgi:hypothetical protein